MPVLHAIILGLVQGLSEFLPISSSGHLLLVPWLFNWHDFDNIAIEKAFDVALHLGTLVAVVGYFRHELVVYVREGLRLVLHRERPSTPEGRLAWLLVLSSLPAAVAGALFEKTIDDKLGKPGLIAASLIVFGVLLGLSDRRASSRVLDDFDRDDAAKVGAAQVLALNPGTSRSGITMTAARYLGFTRDAAARASFLMAIPVTAGRSRVQVAEAGQRWCALGPRRADDRRDRHGWPFWLDRGVGHAAADPNAQLHAFRDLPLHARRRRAGHPCRRLALAQQQLALACGTTGSR